MKRFQNRRVWLGGGGFAAVLIVAIGWFMFIGPELASTRELRDQAAATRQENSVLQLKVKSLQVKSGQLSRYTTELRAAALALPADSGLPAFTRQLSTQAAANRVTLTSVAVGGISAAAGAAPPVAPAGETTPTEAAPAATTPTGAAPAAAAGLVAVQLTVQSNGTLAHQLAFLADVRLAGPRRALVTASQITPGVGAGASSIDGASSFSTQLTVFSAPQTPAQIAQLKKLLSGDIGN